MSDIKNKKLTLTDILIDPGLQARDSVDWDTVKQYAQEMEAGANFPPVAIFADGDAYWLADGYHRYHAAKLIDQDELACEVHQGQWRDAMLYALSANLQNGLRPNLQDRLRALQILLDDPEWQQWSNSELARRSGTNRKTVISHRKPSCPNGQDSGKAKVSRGGTVYEQNTANIGKKKAEPEPDEPDFDIDEYIESELSTNEVVIPDKPDNQSLSWHQWAHLVGDDIKADEPYLSLYMQGLKPSEAKKKMAEQPVTLPDDTPLKEIQSDLRLLKKKFSAVKTQPVGHYLHSQSIHTDMQNLWNIVKFALPYAQCPSCHSQDDNCKWCNGVGWLPEPHFYRLPSEIRNK